MGVLSWLQMIIQTSARFVLEGQQDAEAQKPYKVCRTKGAID
jgi:hypothetical protein